MQHVGAAFLVTRQTLARGGEVTSVTDRRPIARSLPGFTLDERSGSGNPVAVEARPPARGQLVEHVLVIEGDWPHVASVLASMDMVTVRSTNASHVLFTLPSGAAAVARPDENGVHVEVSSRTPPAGSPRGCSRPSCAPCSTTRSGCSRSPSPPDPYARRRTPWRRAGGVVAGGLDVVGHHGRLAPGPDQEDRGRDREPEPGPQVGVDAARLLGLGVGEDAGEQERDAVDAEQGSDDVADVEEPAVLGALGCVLSVTTYLSEGQVEDDHEAEGDAGQGQGALVPRQGRLFGVDQVLARGLGVDQSAELLRRLRLGGRARPRC